MKAIQITIDDALLQRLDADAEVREVGRSAVFRRAVDAYLKRKRTADVDQAYERAYRAGDGLGRDWNQWSDEGVWPED
jgi:predicted transcriptional regulator